MHHHSQPKPNKQEKRKLIIKSSSARSLLVPQKKQGDSHSITKNLPVKQMASINQNYPHISGLFAQAQNTASHSLFHTSQMNSLTRMQNLGGTQNIPTHKFKLQTSLTNSSSTLPFSVTRNQLQNTIPYASGSTLLGNYAQNREGSGRTDIQNLRISNRLKDLLVNQVGVDSNGQSLKNDIQNQPKEAKGLYRQSFTAPGQPESISSQNNQSKRDLLVPQSQMGLRQKLNSINIGQLRSGRDGIRESLISAQSQQRRTIRIPSGNQSPAFLGKKKNLGEDKKNEISNDESSSRVDQDRVSSNQQEEKTLPEFTPNINLQKGKRRTVAQNKAYDEYSAQQNQVVNTDVTNQSNSLIYDSFNIIRPVQRFQNQNSQDEINLLRSSQNSVDCKEKIKLSSPSLLNFRPERKSVLSH